MNNEVSIPIVNIASNNMTCCLLKQHYCANIAIVNCNNTQTLEAICVL